MALAPEIRMAHLGTVGAATVGDSHVGCAEVVNDVRDSPEDAPGRRFRGCYGRAGIAVSARLHTHALDEAGPRGDGSAPISTRARGRRPCTPRNPTSDGPFVTSSMRRAVSPAVN